jgi:hypothetical protein
VQENIHCRKTGRPLIFKSGDSKITWSKQMRNGKEFSFEPESELDFYCREAMFPIKFTKDKNGVATQVLYFSRDLWSREKE